MYVSICLCVVVAVSECLCVCLFVWVALFQPVGFCVLWQFCWPYWPSHTAIYTNASHCIIHFVVVANGSTVFKFVLCFRLHFSLICWSQHTQTRIHTHVYSHCDRIPQLCWSLWLCDTCIGVNCAASCATHPCCVYDTHTRTPNWRVSVLIYI